MKKFILFLAAIAWAVTGFAMSPPRSARLPGIESVESGSHLQATPGTTNELRIAVTPPGCDDIGSILSSLGWTFTEIQESQLSDYNVLAQFDVIFINCSNTAYDVTYDVSGGLGNFVGIAGGTLYASGSAYGYIQKTFPAYILFFDPPHSGAPGSVSADVLDPGLASFLNSPTIDIQFNSPGWGPIQSVHDAVKVYLAGDFTLQDGTRFTNRPLAVSFAYAPGSVIYTSYNNDGQATEQEKKLMNYLVFVTATRKLSAALEDSITSATSGLFAQQELLGSISAGGTTPRHTFSNPSSTELVVGLNWQAGTLRLSVFKPDGSLSKQQEGPPPLVIDIPNAEAGDWSYQVDAIDVSHDNYPYVVQINVPASVVATSSTTPGNSPGIVQVTPSATPENPAGIVQATPSATPEIPANNDIAPGNQGTPIFIIVGGILCLALLFAVVLIGAVVFFVRRRKA